MNKKVLVMAVALLAVAMLATPLFGTVEAFRCRKKTCESFVVNLTTDLAAATMETVVKPNKIIISWDEVMTAYTISVGGEEYNLFDDFLYTGRAVYTAWKPTGETHPILGVPLGKFMEFKVSYMYDFSAVPGGIDGTIQMLAVFRSDDFDDFFMEGTMKIKSLRGTGDLRNVKIEAANGGSGNPSHVGTVCGWPKYFELYCSGAADPDTGTQKDIFRDDVLKLRIIRDSGWVTGDVVNMTVGDKIFTMDTVPYSINWTTTFDALIFFNDDGTNKITFINLVDVTTVYDDGVAIGTLVLKLKSSIDFATTPPTYSGTVKGYGTGALKGVRISGVDVGLVDPVNGIFLRTGTITGWPKYVTNA